MKIKIRTTALAAVLALANFTVSAQEQQVAMGFVTTPEVVLEQATPATADVAIQVVDFNQWVTEFEQKFQSIGQARNGRTFFSGQSSVRVGPLDPNFGRELAMAYERAMFDMRADFVMSIYGRETSRIIRDAYENSSSNKDEFDPVELQRATDAGGNRLEAILDKAISLVDKSLDNALIEQGVPADQVQKLSIEQKRTNYKNNLKKEIVKSAFSNMQGLVPVQTRIFTTEGPNGPQVTLGVIAVQSEKTRQFAIDMSRKRPSNVTGTPKSLSDLLPAQTADYLNEIGLRFSYDEKGRPMLLSYGRYSVSISPDWKPSRVFQSTQNATSIAQSLAEASIIEFMNSNIQISETTLTGSQEEEIVSQVTHFENGNQAGVEQSRADVGETISTFLKSGKSTASGDLRGTSVVKRWEHPDENNIRHVGAVVTWTYAQLDNANAIDDQARGKATAPAASTPANANPVNRGSKAINRADDF